MATAEQLRTLKVQNLEVTTVDDEYAEWPDWLGRYSGEWAPGAIDRWQGKSRWEVGSNVAREYRYWHWGQDAEEVFRWYRAHGWARQPAAEEVARQKAEDYARTEAYLAGRWWFIGILARCEVLLPRHEGTWSVQQFSSAGLWGIESDSGRPYLEEVARGELASLRADLEAIGVIVAEEQWAEMVGDAIEGLEE